MTSEKKVLDKEVWSLDPVEFKEHMHEVFREIEEMMDKRDAKWMHIIVKV